MMPSTKWVRGLSLVCLVLTVGLAQPARAEVWLPKVFSSHMVLQRDKPVVIWGWAQPNETVTVQLGSETRPAKVSERGEWKVILPAMAAGGPYTLTVSGSSTVRLEDVMLGEVWLCSGQSNMEMGIGAGQNGTEEIAAAHYPGLRLLLVPNRWTAQAQTNIDASWQVCSPKTVAEGGWSGFSAAGYYFGRELHKKLGVAVGLIDATWGGTCIESWTPPEGFAAVPALRGDYEQVQLADPRSSLHQQRLGQFLESTEQWLAAARRAQAERTLVPSMPAYPAELLPPHDLQNATALYNGMIHPVCPFGLRGAIWYQGESNLGQGMMYFEKMKALIGGWRRIWGEGDFPFYFVQIAPYNYGGNPERVAELWEAQAAAQTIPHVGMVVVNDIGNLKDIHPTNKQEVGRRLALWALAKDYGQPEVVYSGPTFKAMTVEGDKLRISFDQAAGGLASRDGKPLNWFEIIDAEEGGFVPAEARIEGASVLLTSPAVKHPVAMRFAWSMLAEPNLMNSAGLPAGAFRAGTVPKRDLLVLKVPEAKQYQLVYDLDLAKLGPTLTWDVDNRTKIHQPFDRIAYFLELQGADGNTQFVYVSMDAFSESLDKIGLPTAPCGARFQQNVANLNVYSNVKGLVTGTGLTGGNIEFWPNNYGPPNSASVPNASGQVYDFGDEPGEPMEGYGSMQIHNHDARQTLLAINNWKAGKGADLGIGNQPQGNPDWTFAANAGSYPAKRLRVFVRCK
ncbi:MAG TPA: sialate O-acetylesterase [Candidatus Sulfotelmatobacter sp.]|nr:sialate O-acetylesterase [Candidatus Sulfotelmatobacter sp.]